MCFGEKQLKGFNLTTFLLLPLPYHTPLLALPHPFACPVTPLCMPCRMPYSFACPVTPLCLPCHTPLLALSHPCHTPLLALSHPCHTPLLALPHPCAKCEVIYNTLHLVPVEHKFKVQPSIPSSTFVLILLIDSLLQASHWLRHLRPIQPVSVILESRDVCRGIDARYSDSMGFNYLQFLKAVQPPEQLDDVQHEDHWKLEVSLSFQIWKSTKLTFNWLEMNHY